MPPISPVKVIAGVVAVVLAVAGLYYASEARQGTADLLSIVRLNKPAASAPAHAAEPAARASGLRVIPIGVAGPASGPTGR